MSGEDQERFEDYLELERYIEELQNGRRTRPPTHLTAAQARIYRMAALFRSASPEAAELRPEFARELRARLLAFDQSQDNVGNASGAASALLHEFDEDELEATQKRPAVTPMAQRPETPLTPTPPPTPVAPQEQPVHPRQQPRRARFFSRRGLLAGSAVAAASLVVGVGADHVVETAANASRASATDASIAGYKNMPLTTGPTVPLHVATLDKLGDTPIKFTSDTIVGYIMRNDHDHGETDPGPVIAMSAACTHMGCIVSWSDADQQFHCPCHNGAFTEYGKPAAGPVLYNIPLPRLNVRIVNNVIIVDVPATPGTATKTSTNDTNEWHA